MLSKSREKSSRESLRRNRCVLYDVSIRSNPDKWIGVASSMRHAHVLALRTELNCYEELTGVCRLRGARDRRDIFSHFLAFERGLCCAIEHRVFFSFRPV